MFKCRHEDLFNLRFVNLQTAISDIEVFISNSDETFNEAVLVTGLQSYALSNNYKFDEDQYKVYITASGSADVLFTSEEINYAYGGQYLIRQKVVEGSAVQLPFLRKKCQRTLLHLLHLLRSVPHLLLRWH